MSEVVDDTAKVYEDFNNQADEINSLIKQFMNLKEAVDKFKSNRCYWDSHISALSMNNWAGEIKYGELQKKEACHRTAILETTRLINQKEQELKNLIMKRLEQFSEQSVNLRIKSSNYTNNFVQAQWEYATENLTKEIEHYRGEYKKVLPELPLYRRKLEDLETKCTLYSMNSEADIEEILMINIMLDNIMAKNNNQLQKNRFAHDRLKKIENKIKQKKTTLNDFYK